MRAWLFKDHRQKQKMGSKTPWSVGWIDTKGKRRSRRIGTKKEAEKFRRLMEGQLTARLYETQVIKGWQELLNDVLLVPLAKMIVTSFMQELGQKSGLTNSSMTSFVSPKFTKIEIRLIRKLQALNELLGHVPTWKDVEIANKNKLGPHPRVYQQRFGSLPAALQKADLKPKKNSPKRK